MVPHKMNPLIWEEEGTSGPEEGKRGRGEYLGEKIGGWEI